jgi:deoxyribodipyrimidine photo-lyase
MTVYTRAIFLFHRDLRVVDNTALLLAGEQAEEVIPVFVLDERQIDPKKNAYHSAPAVTCMLHALQELDAALQDLGSELLVLKGNTSEVIAELIERENIDAVYSHIDYTPFSQTRDKVLQQVVEAAGASWIQAHDYLLHEPDDVKTNDGGWYSVFTPFYKKCMTIPVAPVQKGTPKHLVSCPHPKAISIASFDALGLHEETSLAVHGGRSEACATLDRIKDFVRYEQERDDPAADLTTKLSVHHKFGTVSIRETYHAVKDALGMDHALIRELYWRDFATHVAYHRPDVFEGNFNKKYDGLVWEENDLAFKKWCEGRTGFPIVDAGMRQLNTTGWMHNRVRMIVASFLTKDLRIDWRKGERYFAQRLVDYDPCVNNGSWQWAASTGYDAQPYFRIFNPWTQQKNFDPEAEYIKRYIPELRDLSAKEIHALGDKQPDLFSSVEYPKPMVDHKRAREETLAWFKEHLN